jgi:hypothetical protein
MNDATQITEIRELLIELRVTMQHLAQRVDTTFARTDDEIRLLKDRVAQVERQQWITVGIAIIVTTILPYLVDMMKGS